MNVSEIRTQLLNQHAELRTLIEETRASSGRATKRKPYSDDGPTACVRRLASALQAHNLCEEQLLKGILVTVDAWGPARAEIMDERHTAEHAEIHAQLVNVPFRRDRVGLLLDRLLEHMAYEEKAFLGDDVLREDGIVIDAFGG